jgi:hypothetical protein
MGLKGAPSYFQHVLQSEVLHGLIYNICELYIDDVIIFADTAEEMVNNLKLILQRLHEYRVTVSPEKCSFGLEEIEFVGHTLNEEGLHFTRMKLDKVLDISLPVTSKQLKSFLGTETTRQAFYDTQKAVNECPRLFFTKLSLPVFVATDASDVSAIKSMTQPYYPYLS